MSSELKLRRGSTAAHSTFTGADGEVTLDTDKNVVVSHDGITLGGFPHIKAVDLAASSGASLLGYLPAVTGAVETTVQSKLRESVSVLDFVPAAEHAAIKDGTTTYNATSAIQAAVDSGALEVDFGPWTYRLKDSGYVIVSTSGIALKSAGATIIQESWGYPAIEVRASNVSMLGRWRFNYLGVRTAVIVVNTLGYAYVGSGNWKDYGSAIYLNALNGYVVDDFYIDQIVVFGFINAIWVGGDRIKIDSLVFDTCDMGVSGSGGIGQVYGAIYGKNITGTQNVEGHAFYVNDSLSYTSTAKIETIHVDSSPTGASLIKTGGFASLVIGKVSGTDLGGVCNVQPFSKVHIGFIDVELTRALYSGGITYAVLALGATTQLTIDSMRVDTSQDYTSCPSIMQCTTATLTVNALVVNGSTASASASRILYVTSSGNAYIHKPRIVYPNSVRTTYYCFQLDSYLDVLIDDPYYESAGTIPLLILTTVAPASPVYKAFVNPKKIIDKLADTSIKDNSNYTWGTVFTGDTEPPAAITGATPVITYCNVASITQTGATNVTQLRRLANGQRFTLFHNDGNSNLVHNSTPGVEGNIITKTGATILRADWKIAIFQKVGFDMVQVA
jgi:hypothetical protein